MQKYTRAGCVKAMTSVGSPYKLYWIMACALLVYFALGSLVKFLRGFRGVEAIPNHEFWMDFPGYVQDGIFFSVSKIKQMLGKEDKEYDNV